MGFILGETYFLTSAVSDVFTDAVEDKFHPLVTFSVCGILLILTAGYLFVRDAHSILIKVIRSRRADILVAVIIGLSISISLDGAGTSHYRDVVEKLGAGKLALLFSLPITIALLLVFKALTTALRQASDTDSSFFLNDVEKKTKSDDLLGFSEDVARFAERVLNGGAPDSIVFGIDAPWGIGKSTFVNLCVEYWEEQPKHAVIVYRFNLLRYEDRSNLLEKFVDGLIRAIQKHSFVPEIRPLISRYSRFLKSKASFLGIDFDIFQGSYTIDDAFEDLESALAKFDRQIIVVVDDLDRVSFSAARDVLFVIKKSFTLPNISYVLCYDTENIIAQERPSEDAERVMEFLEKFVNVKFSLFLSADTLSSYISKNFDKAVQHNLGIDPFTIEKTKQTISAIEDIYKSQEFHRYQPFLGDIRKLKRLINTLVLLEIEKTDFENSDIDKHDLIHLLLIYINYPNIFRKIYSTETDGKRGFFSLVAPYDDDYPVSRDGEGRRERYSESDYANSTNYTDYIKKCSPNQHFLLNKIFSVSQRLKSSRIDSVSEDVKNSLACFNGSRFGKESRNLEAYLNLIVRLSKPQKRDQYRFYLNLKNRFSQGIPIEELFADEEFSLMRGEDSRTQFLRILVNSAREFDTDTSNRLITYVLRHIRDYSLFANEKIGLGFRDDLAYFLIKLLDTAGWSDANNKRRDNTDENIAEIANWIFGEGKHRESGVLDSLGAKDRGALGLYDLMIFRLYCSADRGGNFFNLQRALSKHGDPSAPTSGQVSAIAIGQMREISQRLFRIFKEQYIVPQTHLFDVLDHLTIEELAGKYYGYLNKSLNAGQIDEEELNNSIAALKSRMKTFISYQLGNTFIRSGVGCGYYDETGNDDRHGISSCMNDYLFDQCFNPAISQKNYEHFVDYLLANFASRLEDDEGRYLPTIAEFTKILEKERLVEYWRVNSLPIRGLQLPKRTKLVVTGNYIASYQKDLESVYRVLDELVASPGANERGRNG